MLTQQKALLINPLFTPVNEKCRGKLREFRAEQSMNLVVDLIVALWHTNNSFCFNSGTQTSLPQCLFLGFSRVKIQQIERVLTRVLRCSSFLYKNIFKILIIVLTSKTQKTELKKAYVESKDILTLKATYASIQSTQLPYIMIHH